jgi:hypothetical protein
MNPDLNPIAEKWADDFYRSDRLFGGLEEDKARLPKTITSAITEATQLYVEKIAQLEKENADIQRQTEEQCPVCNYYRDFKTLCKCGLTSCSNQNLRNQLTTAESRIKTLEDALKKAGDSLNICWADSSMIRTEVVRKEFPVVADAIENIRRFSIEFEAVRKALNPPTTPAQKLEHS